MDPVPRIVTLDPHTLGEVLGDVRTLAQATGAQGRRGRAGAGRRRPRSTACGAGARAAPRRRVVLLKWLDPVFVGGHWVPQLIERRGRRGPARPARRAVRAARLGGGRRRAAGGRGRGAVRLRRRARVRGGPDLQRRAGQARCRARRGRRRRPRGSRAPARAWWSGSSGSATCCSPTSCPSRGAGCARGCLTHLGDRAHHRDGPDQARRTSDRGDGRGAPALGQLLDHEGDQQAAERARRGAPRSRCRGDQERDAGG